MAESGRSSSACGLCCTRIKGLSVELSGRRIISDIDFHMHCGELTVLIGPNGAGKTTLLKAILGELPSTGEVSFLDPKNDGPARAVIGYVPQKLAIDVGAPYSVLDLFSAALARRPAFLGASAAFRRRALEALKLVAVENLADRRLGTLSGGELQRVLLALAIEPLPTLLLLDEPFAHVDRRGMELFYELVARLKRARDLSILLVSHDLPLAARYADRMVLLDGAIMASGAPEELFADPGFQSIFGAVPRFEAHEISRAAEHAQRHAR